MLVGLRKNQRRQKFVCLFPRVLRPDRVARRSFTTLPSPKHNRVPGLLRPVPATIAIHGEIAADDRRDLRAAFRQAGGTGVEKIRAAGRRRIPSVGEGVDENVRDACGVRRVRERDEMPVVAMDTAIGDQAEKMETMPARLGESFLRHLGFARAPLPRSLC